MSQRSETEQWFEHHLAPRLRREYESELRISSENEERVDAILLRVRDRCARRPDANLSGGEAPRVCNARGEARSAAARWRLARAWAGRLTAAAVLAGAVAGLLILSSQDRTIWRPVASKPQSNQNKPSVEPRVASLRAAAPNPLVKASANTTSIDPQDAHQGLQLLEASVTSAYSVYDNPLAQIPTLRKLIDEHQRAQDALEPKSSTASLGTSKHEHLIANLAANLLGRTTSFD